MDLPNIDELPTLDDSERWHEFLDSLTAARERREKLRARADELEKQIKAKAEEIPELRVAVATGDATEGGLDAAKEEKAELEEELTEIRENELPAQLETIELLEDRRSDIKSEEGDKFAGEYADAQRTLQKQKRELLQKLATVCEQLDELGSLKDANDVGSYQQDVAQVPPVHGCIRGQSRSDNVAPKRLRRRADELADTLETLGTTN